MKQEVVHALPLPATGEQTGPKACQRQDQPGRLLEGETPLQALTE
jgi:hypothetical protein